MKYISQSALVICIISFHFSHWSGHRVHFITFPLWFFDVSHHYLSVLYFYPPHCYVHVYLYIYILRISIEAFPPFASIPAFLRPRIHQSPCFIFLYRYIFRHLNPPVPKPPMRSLLLSSYTFFTYRLPTVSSPRCLLNNIPPLFHNIPDCPPFDLTVLFPDIFSVLS